MALLLLPLLLKINQGELVDSVSYEQTSPLTGKLKGIIAEWNNVDNYYRWIFFAVGAFAVLLGIFSKEWHIVLLPLGVLLLQSYAFGTFINLPFSNFIIVFSIVILLYIPLSFLMGYLFSKVAGFLDKYSNIIPALLLITFSLFFLYSNKNLINKKKYEYVTWADQRAFEWINENIGESARFLVDGFNIYNGTSSVGSDAGWWIPLLTERANTMPPQYALLNETPIDPNYSKNVVEIINTFTQTDPTTEEGISAMCQWGISHIYIGQKGGLMNQAQPLLNWHDWPDTSSLELIYAQDRVKIYAFDQNLCN
jgi:hypothetical protein